MLKGHFYFKENVTEMLCSGDGFDKTTLL